MKTADIFNGVDQESELHVLLFMLKKGGFYFDSMSDPDYLMVSNHLQQIGVAHKITHLNRIHISLR